MKVWVCRDVYGYSLWLKEPEINKRLTFFEPNFFKPKGGTAYYEAFILDLCPKIFKRFTGIKRHMKVGEKKLMDWKKPLE